MTEHDTLSPPPSRSLTGQLAVVTGASRGIGRATAIALAQRGANIALIARSPEPLARVASDVSALGVEALAVTADVADESQVLSACTRVREALGAATILVNNAGTVVRSRFDEMSFSQWRSVMATNVDGVFLVTRAFVADLVAQRGRIITISSIAGHQGTAELSAYCASKHAVLGMTRALAEELRDSGVRVNAICPGSVDTDMLRAGLPDASPDMTPEDIADCVVFLATEAPAALTGACVDVFG